HLRLVEGGINLRQKGSLLDRIAVFIQHRAFHLGTPLHNARLRIGILPKQYDAAGHLGTDIDKLPRLHASRRADRRYNAPSFDLVEMEDSLRARTGSRL